MGATGWAFFTWLFCGSDSNITQCHRVKPLGLNQGFIIIQNLISILFEKKNPEFNSSKTINVRKKNEKNILLEYYYLRPNTFNLWLLLKNNNDFGPNIKQLMLIGDYFYNFEIIMDKLTYKFWQLPRFSAQLDIIINQVRQLVFS